MKKKQVINPYRVLSNNPEVMKTELDRMGVPKSLRKSKWNFRTANYFYRVFDSIGSQLAVINQGLQDNGPVRTWQFK